MRADSKIYVAGHRGMVGSALCRHLTAAGFGNLVFRSSSELDLRNTEAVADFFASEKPEYVFLAAARVGGILANLSYPAEFIHDNLMIQTNVIHQAYIHRVKKLLFLGSSCIYPKMAPQPLKESYLLTAPLEPSNEPYAVAKIAGIKMCEAYRAQYGCDFISVMPTNLYGPGDKYDLQNSHVLPAMLRKFTEAKRNGNASVELWGTGTPRREFLHVDDLAEACVFLMMNYTEKEFVNIGTGEDLSLEELAEMIRDITGYTGTIKWDTTKPDGTPRKLMDVSRINALGWKAKIPLREGIGRELLAFSY